MKRGTYMKGDGVPCPECHGATRVKGTSPAKGHRHAIRRRRGCLKCGVRFTTIEMPAGDVDATARKINDRVEFNDRFMALDDASRLAVRQMVTALEQAAARRHAPAMPLDRLLIGSTNNGEAGEARASD